MRTQPPTSQPQQAVSARTRNQPKGSTGLGCLGKSSGWVPWSVVLLVGLVACSDDKPVRQTTNPAGPTATVATDTADSESAPLLEAPTAAGQRKYKVVAGTTYFFDAPTATSKPTGNYLLRGDVLYGDEVRNGFVRTQFKLPTGATATGWLKQQELGLLASTPAAPASKVRVTRNTPTVPEPKVAPAAPAALQQPTAPQTPATSRAIVQVARSYFYDSPDLSQPRKAHCVQGDKVWLGNVQGEAVYVTFTNWEKVTTRGWMRRDALRPVQ